MRGIPDRPDAEAALRTGQRLAWISIAYICSTVGLLFLVMGGSQALKTEFVEDALSLLPPIFFLVSDKISRRPPNRRFPFGYERVVSAGYVGSAIALLAVGLLLFLDGAMKLAIAEHPTIGGFALFGRVVWTGWLAIPVLLWCAIPAHFLGRAKRKAAAILYDKTLASDAEMNEANWQSAAAAILGIVGVAFGLWWADSAAAVLISVEIIRSGWVELRTAVGDVTDRSPKTVDEKDDDPIDERIAEFLSGQPWVKDVVVRVRERGRELTAEAHVVPIGPHVSVDDLSTAQDELCRIDPRLSEVTIAPVKSLPEDVAKARDPVEA
ncbi:MAG: cation transporter [Sphingomonas sp.]|nr:cation transporter [Sphingomonas sp.]